MTQAECEALRPLEPQTGSPHGFRDPARPPQALQVPAHRILLLLRTLGCSKELWPIGVALRDEGYACTVVIGRELLVWRQQALATAARYAKAGFCVMNYFGRPVPDASDQRRASSHEETPTPSALAGLLSRAGKPFVRLATSRVGFALGMNLIWDFLRYFKRYTEDLRTATTLLAQQQPSVIVLQENVVLNMETIITMIAKARGIPTLMIPGADNGQCPEVRTQTHLWNGRAIAKDTRRLPNRLLATLFPRWARPYRGVRLLYYPPAQSLAAWCAGLMSADPWLPQCWVSTRAALSERTRTDIERCQGVGPQQLVVTGQAVMDGIFELWKSTDHAREKILSPLGLQLSAQTRVVLFTIPQLMPMRALTPVQEMAFLERVLRTLVEAPHVQVILSLYGGADPARYQSLAAKYRAVMARDIDVRHLVAVCDLFVCVRSSIIWTAIACRKPTLALDFWDVGHVNFYECPGVTVIRRQQDLQPMVQQLLRDAHTYQAVVERMNEAAALWASHFDGHATERTTSLIGELVRSHAQPRGATSQCPAS